MSKKPGGSKVFYEDLFPYKTYDEILTEKDRHMRFRHGMVVMSGIFLMFCAIIIGISMIWNRSTNPFEAETHTGTPGELQMDDPIDEPQMPMVPEKGGETFTIPVVPTPDFRIDRTQGMMQVTDVSRVVKKAADFVVGVESESYQGTVGSKRGSGVVISENGYILTGSAVIRDSDSISVTLNGGKCHSAFVVGNDPYSGIAVLKIDVDGLTPAEITDSDGVKVGQAAIAVGSIAGQPQKTATFGVVTGVEWSVPIDNTVLKLMQTDAKLSNSSSGGPLLNQFGQVIGINVPYIRTSDCPGLSFVLPINMVRPVAEELIRNGSVTGRPMLGITADRLSSMSARFYGYPEGIFISSIDPGSGAAEAGLKAGDVITNINEFRITSVADATEIRDAYRAGDTLSITYYREGITQTVIAELMDRQYADQYCNF